MALDFQTLEDIQTIHDRLSTNKYKIFIPDCPDAGKMSDLHVRCTKVTLPLGEEVNVNEVTINGFVNRKSTGDTKQPADFSVTFVDDQKLSVRNRFKLWKEYCAGTESGAISVSDASYKRDIEVMIFTDAKEYVCSYIIPGCFPTKVNDVELSSSTSPDAVTVDVTFSISRAAYRKDA